MKVKTWVALLALYLVWGSTYLAIRYAVETIPPFLAAGARFLVAGLILYTWRRLAGDASPTPRQWRSTAIVGTLLLLGGNGLVSWAEQRVASGIAALIVGSVPLWMALFEALRPRGIRPGWQTIIGLLIGFGGIALLVGPTELIGRDQPLDPGGVAALLLAAFLWSLGSIYSRSADLPPSSLMTTAAEMLTGSLGLFLFGTLVGDWSHLHLSAISLRSLFGLAYLILAGSLIGFVAYAWLLRNVSVSLASTYAYVNPLIAILLGAWLADEVLTARTWLAALIIIGSVIIINTARPKAPKVIPEATPSLSD
jgi:drug/metabolite transporter (DMT)-like permease